MRDARRRDVVGWAAVGAVGTVGVLGAASIGLFLLPVAGVLGVALARRSAPGQRGVLIGVALALAAFGLVDLVDGTPPCTESGVSDPPALGRPSSCESGGIPPEAFLGAAACFAAAFVITFRNRPSPR